MGIEGQKPFETTPLGQTANESLKEKIVEMRGVSIRIFPKQNGIFTVYAENCIFEVTNKNGTLLVSNITPVEYQGAWQAPALQKLVQEAFTTEVFNL